MNEPPTRRGKAQRLDQAAERGDELQRARDCHSWRGCGCGAAYECRLMDLRDAGQRYRDKADERRRLQGRVA